MVRLSLVNLYLHGFTNPKIVEYDTLTSEEKWNEHADIIFANPPFMSPKGGIKPHKRFSVESSRSEVLFVDYIAEHLTPNGRAAVIVPEGIIFQGGKSYKALREMLVEKYLYAVVSLPAGVFNPYSGVKTSILLMDKTLAKRTDKILFAKIENDGFDLGAQRRANTKSELLAIASAIKEYVKCVNDSREFSIDDFTNLVVATKEKIGKNGDWNLSGERYKVYDIRSSIFPKVSLGEIALIQKGTSITKAATIEGKYQVIAGGQQAAYFHDSFNREGETITVSASGAYAGFINFFTIPIFASDCTTIKSNDDEVILTKFLYFFLKSIQDEIYLLQKGMGQPHVYGKDLERIQIPLPSLEMQKEIVAEIEGWQKIIDGARQVIENYKPQIQIDPSWEMVELGEVYNIKYGLAESIPDNIDENGIKIISTAETNIDGNLDLSKIRKIKYFKKYDKFILNPDTLLFNWRNAPKHVGKTVYFNESSDKYIYASFLLALTKKNDQINNLFFWVILNKLREDGYFKRMSRQAVNQTNFNGGELAKVVIPLPSLKVQNKIVEAFLIEQKLVDANKKLITMFEQKITEKIASVWGK